MNPASEDIKDILVADGVGAFGTDLFISLMPETPDACVSIYDTGGMDPILNYVYDYPTVQVRIRGAIFGYQNAWDKAKEVKDALHGLTNETWNSTRYIQIGCVGDIMFIHYDDNNRPTLTVNFLVHRTDT